MQHHPALPYKYDLVQHTRGLGIEVGEGITAESEPLYPHFRKVESLTDADRAAGLDFVLVCHGSPGIEVENIKVGGFLCVVRHGGVQVLERDPDFNGKASWHSVDLSIPPKTVCVVRYGGFGDMIQAANIFPALKRDGWRVVVMTTPQGKDIVAHDPHVDEFLLQDTDQVPNNELTAYWDVQSARFERFINLSESVEGTLLAYPGRANHGWPDALRRRELGKNYLEWTAQLAELPYLSETRFYPAEEERQAADRFLTRIRRRAAQVPEVGPTNAPATFNIMFTLAGSSVHKMYPHQDDVIANVLAALPEATFTLVGDYACQLLEQGWEEHHRVNCLAGRIGIRETLAVAQRMDCVVGPETGVLNAVGFERNAKVILLSHSSPENLTKHWVNTEAIEPPTACYPCHRLHHDRRHCPEHEPTGASQCAFDIDPFRVFAAIGRAYAGWQQLRALKGLS
jgi:ADP-heptose:LPS heptosyltransferase